MTVRSSGRRGRAFLIADPQAKAEHLKVFMDRLLPGRWAEARKPNAKELKATTLLGLRIDEAFAKLRQGPPNHDAADYDLPGWAGEIPLQLIESPPRPDPGNAPRAPARG